MTESDQLLTKADALLARWRSGAVVPRPPADYPVLTDVVKVQAGRSDTPLPEIPSEPHLPHLAAVAVASAAETAVRAEVPVLNLPEIPDLGAPDAHAASDAPLVTNEDTDGFPRLPVIDESPAPADAAIHALEERLRSRVLEAIEPCVTTLIEEPLRLRVDELTRQFAANIARETRDEIITLVLEAVRSAVAHELDSQRGERSPGR